MWTAKASGRRSADIVARSITAAERPRLERTGCSHASVKRSWRSWQDGSPTWTSLSHYPSLYLRRDLGIHQRRAAVRVDHLARDPGSLLRADERCDVSDIFGSSQAPHRSPPAPVPAPDELLGLGRKRVQDAVLGPPGADPGHGNAARGAPHAARPCPPPEPRSR